MSDADDTLCARLKHLFDLFERNLLPVGFDAIVPGALDGVAGKFDVLVHTVERMELHGFGFGPLPRDDAQHLSVGGVQIHTSLYWESGLAPLYDPIYRHLFLNRKTGRGYTVTPHVPVRITLFNHGLHALAVRGCAYGEVLP